MARPVTTLALAMLLTAASAGTNAAQLRVGVGGDADALDPAQGGSFVGRIVFAALCDKLIDIDTKLEFVPQLATKWSWSADNLALTMTVRDGVVFHDGERLDAAAVKANLERYRAAPESRRKAELRPVSGVEVVDPMTIRITLSEPYAPLLSVLTDRAGMMMSPKAIAALGERIASNPVCSGPFKFTQRVAQERIVVERFDRYWNAAAIHVDRITYMIIPDNNIRLINLRAGQLDLIERVAATDIKSVRADRRIKLVTDTAVAYQTMSINVANMPRANNPLGRDARVRAAFEATIDRNVINQVVFEGNFVPSNQPEAPGTKFHNPSLPVPARDPARAHALLKEAGHERVAFTLYVPNAPVEVQVGEVIQSMAAEGGFDIKVQAFEAATLVGRTTKGDYEAAIGIWSGRVDPDTNITIWVACDGFLNWGKYCNPKLDEIFVKARGVTDTAERQRLYRDASAIYLADRPHLMLYHYRWLWALSDKLDGFVPYADGIIRPQGMRVRD